MAPTDDRTPPGPPEHDGVALPAAERLLLDVAAETLAERDPTGGGVRIACLDLDPATPAAVLTRLAPRAVAVQHDRLSDERRQRDRLPEVAAGEGGLVRAVLEPAEAVRDADLVLHRVPPSLDALDELATLTAALAAPGVVLLGVGNNRHLDRSMNTVLGRSFADVRASRGRGKFRVLVSRHPRAAVDPARYPLAQRLDELDLEIRAHGGVFAGTRLDAGTRLLWQTRERWPAPGSGTGSVIDAGCGTGVLAATLARLGHRAVLAIDESLTACRSAEATVAANRLDSTVAVRREDGLTGQPDRSADLIVSNPPFHRGTAKDSTPTLAMITAAARVLRPGGELWLVYNSHLPYLPALRRVGRTEIVARDRSYLVTRTVAGLSAS